MLCLEQKVNINHRAKGSRRDKLILQAIEKCHVLDTEQIWAIFFNQMKYGQRKAQERLQKLYERGCLKRDRIRQEPFFYYIEKRPGQPAHQLGVNWIKIWLQHKCRSWEKIHSFSYEQDYKILRTDGFAAIKNIVNGNLKFYFIEMDRGTNTFDKVQKYCDLYENEKYQGWWWVALTERFPPVLVVTTSLSRKESIEQLITEKNIAGLEFQVSLLDSIKREVLTSCGKH